MDERSGPVPHRHHLPHHMPLQQQPHQSTADVPYNDIYDVYGSAYDPMYDQLHPKMQDYFKETYPVCVRGVMDRWISSCLLLF